MKTLFLFVGRPHVGKTTAAANAVNGPTFSIAGPLRHSTMNMVDMNLYSFGCIDYAKFKRTKWPLFGDRTGREIMFDVADNYWRATYGQDIFVKLLWNEIETTLSDNLYANFAVDDVGFAYEIEIFKAYAAKSPYEWQIVIVEIVRDSAPNIPDNRKQLDWAAFDLPYELIENHSDDKDAFVALVRSRLAKYSSISE